jgi:hypothetical protein
MKGKFNMNALEFIKRLFSKKKTAKYDGSTYDEHTKNFEQKFNEILNIENITPNHVEKVNLILKFLKNQKPFEVEQNFKLLQKLDSTIKGLLVKLDIAINHKYDRTAQFILETLYDIFSKFRIQGLNQDQSYVELILNGYKEIADGNQDIDEIKEKIQKNKEIINRNREIAIGVAKKKLSLEPEENDMYVNETLNARKENKDFVENIKIIFNTIFTLKTYENVVDRNQLFKKLVQGIKKAERLVGQDIIQFESETDGLKADLDIYYRQANEIRDGRTETTQDANKKKVTNLTDLYDLNSPKKNAEPESISVTEIFDEEKDE